MNRTSFEADAADFWSKMTPAEREKFLGELEGVSGRQPSWGGGLPVWALAQIGTLDDLPHDLRGRLIMAVTEHGFSTAEASRVEAMLRGIAE